MRKCAPGKSVKELNSSMVLELFACENSTFLGDLQGGVQIKMNVPGVTGFALAPKYSKEPLNFLFATFVPEKKVFSYFHRNMILKGVPALVTMYRYPRVSDNDIVSRKSFFKV